MTNTILRIYQNQKKAIESTLGGSVRIWENNRSGLLQIPGILCVDNNASCYMYKLNFLPQIDFARRTVCSALQSLTELPYDIKRGEQLITAMLWSGDYFKHFNNGFITLLNNDNHLMGKGEVSDATLMIPIAKEVEQIDVNVKIVTEGIIHAYANAIYDLLSQPTLDYWDKRYAAVIELR